MFYALTFGFIFALGLILQLGPQNMFILQQGARSNQLLSTIIVVSLASLCDTVLIILAVAGVSASVLHFPWVKYTLLVLGIAFLAYYGYVAWRSNTNATQAQTSQTLIKLVLFTLSVSLLNPGALIDTIVTIGTVSTTFAGHAKIAFTVGCIITSWLWFILLAVTGKWLLRFAWFTQYIGKITAIIMFISALYLLGYFILSLIH